VHRPKRPPERHQGRCGADRRQVDAGALHPGGVRRPPGTRRTPVPRRADKTGTATSPKVDSSPEDGRGRAEWRLSDGSEAVLSTQRMSRQAQDLAASLEREAAYTEGVRFRPKIGLPPFSMRPVIPGQVVGTFASAVCTRPDGTATVIGAVSGPVPDRYAGFLGTGAPLAAREIDGADVLVVTTTGQAEGDLDVAGRATPERWAPTRQPRPRPRPTATCTGTDFRAPQCRRRPADPQLVSRSHHGQARLG